jgi:diguanylate cyclase (GGDEF)-like protein
MNKELRLAYLEIAALRVKQRQMEKAIRDLTRVASTDELTGLRNRRRFGEDLAAACAFARREGSPLSLIMLDVDHFKSYNDSFGHIAGDRILCIFAEILGGMSRQYDVVARFGGEEFTVLLPATDHPAAREAGERQRRALESYDWPLHPITASLGIATLAGGDDVTPIRLLDRADLALYQSKHDGRNRITHFDELPDLVGPGWALDHVRRSAPGGIPCRVPGDEARAVFGPVGKEGRPPSRTAI